MNHVDLNSKTSLSDSIYSVANKNNIAISNPSNLIKGLIMGLGSLMVVVIIINNQNNASTQDNSAAITPTSAPLAQTAEPTAVSTPNREQVANVIQEWQNVKKYSFINYDTSRLDSVLTGKALEETVGGVNWWKNTPGAEYYEIELIEMTIDSITFPDATTANVTAHVTERKSDNQSGNRTSTYKVVYYLVYQGGQWYIRDWVV